MAAKVAFVYVVGAYCFLGSIDLNGWSLHQVIDVGGKEFRFAWSREFGDLCDIYEERQSSENGNGLLVESGCAWRKLNVQRILDESTTKHVKMRSEEAALKSKERKYVIHIMKMLFIFWNSRVIIFLEFYSSLWHFHIFLFLYLILSVYIICTISKKIFFYFLDLLCIVFKKKIVPVYVRIFIEGLESS